MVAVLVRGIGDLGSAVAHRLFRAGYGVVVHDRVRPASTRRAMAFTDAIWDEYAELDGVVAVRVDEPERLPDLLALRVAVAVVVTSSFAALRHHLRPDVIIDARMPRHARQQRLRGLARLTIGLGPGFVAGETTDVVVETRGRDSRGRLIPAGASRPSRLRLPSGPDRCLYAPGRGVFRTSRHIGDLVKAGDLVGHVGGTALRAPLTGRLLGVTRSGLTVSAGTKIAEIDRRGAGAVVHGIEPRLARIAEGVLCAIQEWSTRLAV